MGDTAGGGTPDRLHEGAGPRLGEISRRVVQLHKSWYGKGPTKARTYWNGDVITVVLRGGLTQSERTLRDAGRGEAVLQYRMHVQEALRERFKREMERLTGRTVVGFMSGVQLNEPEIAVEVFVLEPSAGDCPSIEADVEVDDVAGVRARP